MRPFVAEEFWKTNQELRALAWLAAEGNMTVALRGSAAKIVIDAFTFRSPLDSLLCSLPPFSDLDFIVENRGHARFLQPALPVELPTVRFFRVDVLTSGDLERYLHSNLQIAMPRVVFGMSAHGLDLAVQLDKEGPVKLGAERRPVEPP